MTTQAPQAPTAASPSISTRRLEPELMDDPSLDSRTHEHALRGLARLNQMACSASLILDPLLAIARRHKGALRVLDLATASGDIPISIARHCARRGIETQIQGCDISPVAVEAATRRARAARLPLRFFRHDVLQGMPEGEWDVITSSLFLHHLSRDRVVQLLSGMRDAARVAVIVSDLRRSRLGLAMAFAASRCGTSSRVVRTDAIRSVRAAFSTDEMRQMADDAGLTSARVRTRWPERVVIEWVRP